MNYKRVEWIFLIAFFLLNSYLLLTWHEGNHSQNNQGTVEDVEVILSNEGITFPKTLDNHIKTGCYISAKEVDLSEEVSSLKEQKAIYQGFAINSTLHPSISIRNKEDIKKVQRFLKQSNHILKGNSYQLLEQLSDKKLLLYTQTYKDVPILDETAELEFYIQKNQIIKYHQKALTDIKSLRDQEKLITQKKALYTLYINSKLSRGDSIEWIKLAYTKIYSENRMHVYVPTWLIQVKNKSGLSEIEKVNALTNHLIVGISETQEEEKNNE